MINNELALLDNEGYNKCRIEEHAAVDDLNEELDIFEKTARLILASVLLNGLCSLCATCDCKAARQVWLDTLDVKLAQSGFSNSKRNRSIDNNPIRLAGVEYAHGVGTHPPGRFLIDLARHAERFVALVGIDDERKTSGTAEFIVKGDGRVLFASGIMRGGQPPKRIDVDVRGVMLSPHETNEWHPSVDNNGMIIYTRWDYVDRGFNQAHHPWITLPDGRDSRAIHGNFAPSDRIRPHSEMDSRAIPHSHKIVATAACHHGQAYGSLVLVDPKVKDDDLMAQARGQIVLPTLE